MTDIFFDREGHSPNEVEWAFILDQFAKPFADIKFREQSKGKYAAYIDSRTLQDRLDYVVGPNWETKFETVTIINTNIVDKTPTPKQEKHKIDWYKENKPDEYMPELIERANSFGKVKNKNDIITEYHDVRETGVRCDLVVFGKVRSDTGTSANAELVKSAFSDSLKRAAVQWGIGRYLYSLGFFKSENPELPEWAIPEEAINFSGMIKAEQEKISALNPPQEAKDALRLVMSRYSTLVSLLQKRRILANLKEITSYVESSK